MENNIVARVEKLFLDDGFTRMSDYFGDVTFKNKLSAHEILWKSDYYYFVVKHDDEKVNIYYSNQDFGGTFELYTSFSDALPTSKIEDIVYDVIHGMSPQQEEIIRKYIDIDENYVISKYDYVTWYSDDDKSESDEDYLHVNPGELFHTSLLKINEQYKEYNLIYGRCHPNCLNLLMIMYEICYINGQNEEAYDYARQLTEDVGAYYGEDSIEYYQSVFFQCQIMVEMRMAAQANVLLLDAFTHLNELKDTDSLETLRILRLIVKCYSEMRLFNEANTFAGLYVLLCANKKDYPELIEESKVLYLHSLYFINKIRTEEIDEAFKAIDLKNCQWDLNLAWSVFDVCIDYGIDKKALDVAQDLYGYYKYNYGVQNIHTVKCVSNIAISVYNLQHIKDALELQRYVIETYKTTLGEKNPRYIDSLYTMANMYYRDDKWGMAKGYSEEAFSLYCDVFTKHHPDSLKALLLSADIDHASYRYEDELNERIEAYNIACELYSPNDLKTIELLPKIIRTYSCCAMYDDSVSLAKNYVDIMTAIYGEIHIETVESLNVYSLALSDAGLHEDALNVDFQSLKICSQLPDKDDYEIDKLYRIVRFVALDLYHLNRKNEAFNIIEKAIFEIEERYGDDSPYIDILMPLYDSLNSELDL